MKFNDSITIGSKTVSRDSKTFIIAEAGVNHNGDMQRARELIDVAVAAGVDAVKFQTFRAEHLILQKVQKSPYQLKTTDAGETQFDMLKRLEVSKEENHKLKEYCDRKGIIFLTTPFDECSLDELDELDLAAYKIASTDTTNIPFLKKVAAKQKPIIFSTGMSYMNEIKQALEEMHAINKDIIMLHCSANYPIADDEINLNVMKTFQRAFDILLGYSDHSVGVGAAPFAVALGAKMIEKHFTLSKDLVGPDHKASVTPDELCQLVSDIRRVEAFLGSDQKEPTRSEEKTRISLQKCFVARRDIKQGEVFSDDTLVAKRTGGVGISPIEYKNVFGQSAKKDFHKDEIITL